MDLVSLASEDGLQPSKTNNLQISFTIRRIDEKWPSFTCICQVTYFLKEKLLIVIEEVQSD